MLYQLRIDLDDNAAEDLINNKSITNCKRLQEIIKTESAVLVCQYEAFRLFVEECEKNNLIDTPLYKWTKDTIQNKIKKKKYMKSFTIYVRNKQLYEKDIADRIEKKIISLNCDCILKINKYDSDPQNNPQPPKKYL